MIEYYPWSKNILNESLKMYDKGGLPTLDIELTAKCSKASCIYCDSKPAVGSENPKELKLEETEKLIRDAADMGLKWVYTCGLGEPFEDQKFLKLVSLLHKLDARISLFTNGLFIDRKKAKWLHEHDVYLILKLDTFDEAVFDKILGVENTAKKVYHALDLLLEAGYGNKKLTDLALSIVPTQLSYGSIKNVIAFAKENSIFPSIGELEQAGRMMKKRGFSKLMLSNEQTSSLRKVVEEMLWADYKRPICPAIITGMHIDHIGNCVVDRITGLNCKWFLLREPDVKTIGNVRNDSLSELHSNAREYREKCFNENSEEIEVYEKIDYVFGGCGGNPKTLIKIAKEHLF